MGAAVPGAVVTSATPNTTTNTSLTVALSTTTVGEENIVTLSGLAAGTGVNPTVTTPAGWTKKFEQMSNSGTPSDFVAVYGRQVQAGDGASQVFSWTNQGQMVSACQGFGNPDPTTPIPYSTSIPHASGAGSTYAISGTTGADAGLLVYGGANRTGNPWSNLSDNDAGQRTLSGSATLCQRITAAELAGGTAFSKTMTGSASTIGAQWAFIVKGNPANSSTVMTLAGSGSLSATGTPSAPGSAALAGTGSLSLTGTPAGAGSAALTGQGSLSASTGVQAAAVMTLIGTGSLSVTGTPAASAVVALTGSGALDTAGQPAAAAAAALTGDGVLSAGAEPTASAGASFSGAGQLAAAPQSADTSVAVVATGTGTLAQGHLVRVLIQNPVVLTAAAEPAAGPDLGSALPILLALTLTGTLALPAPVPDPGSYGLPEDQFRAMRGVSLILPTPCIVEGRPTLPLFWARSESLATSQIGGSGG